MSRLRWILILFVLLSAGSWATGSDDSLRVGVFPRRAAADTQAMFRPLAEFLSERLGRPVSLATPADYLAFWSALGRGEYDLVHYNQYHYVRAKREFGHRLIAKNEEFGRSDISAAILVRRDEPYRSLHDLRGRKILFGGGRSAMVSYVLAVDMLRGAGLQDSDYIAQFAQNPLKALIALNYMQGDAAAAGDGVTALPLVSEMVDTEGLRVLAHSSPIPHLPWAVSARVDERQAWMIRDALLSLNDSARGRELLGKMQLTGLRPAGDAEYDSVRRIIARVLGENY